MARPALSAALSVAARPAGACRALRIELTASAAPHTTRAPCGARQRQPMARGARAEARGVRVYAEAQTSGAAEVVVPEVVEEAVQELPALPEGHEYYSFRLDGGEYLVPRLPDGALDLAGSVIRDYRSCALSRPAVLGPLPEQPAGFAEHPWYSEYFGDVFAKKPPKLWVFKMYLVRVHKQGATDPILDLSQVWVLDSSKRAIEKCSVRWLAPLDTKPADLVLRFKRDGSLTVDTLQSMPTPDHIVQAHREGVEALSRLELELMEAEAAGLETEEAAEEAERAAETAARGERAAEGLPEGPAGEEGSAELLYGEELLRDFVEEVDDELGTEFEEDFDAPAADY